MLNENELNELNNLFTRLTGGKESFSADMDAAAVLKAIAESVPGEDAAELGELFDSDVYKKLIKNTLGSRFTLDLSDIDSAESLNKYYKDTYSALSKLSEMAGKNQEVTDKFSKPMDNIKFMDTLNNVFPYIQLPLKLNDGRTGGELYVFKNGRTTSDEKESKSVLLHLNMDSLGPTDIHMELKSGYLKLRFFCNDDTSMELLSGKVNELEGALSKKGFSMTTEFSVRTVETNNMVEALSGGGENVPEFKYNFDIRA